MSGLFEELFSLLPIIIFLVIFVNLKKKAGRNNSASSSGSAGASRPGGSALRAAEDAESRISRPPQPVRSQQMLRPLQQSVRSKDNTSGSLIQEMAANAQSKARNRSSREAREVAKAATGQTEKPSSIRNMGSLLMEDRKNDWLTRQIREEHRIKMRGDFWDLGAAHDKDCDARSLKNEHLLAHDDSVDNGEW